MHRNVPRQYAWSVISENGLNFGIKTGASPKAAIKEGRVFIMEIGKRLRHLRKELLKMTLEDFGNRLGLKKSTLSNIENGTYNLTEQTRRSIMREFNVNENWLLTGEGEPFVELTREKKIEDFFKDVELGTSEFKKAFIEGLAKLTTEEWVSLEKICKKMVESVGPVVSEETSDVAPEDPDSMSSEELEAIYKNETLPKLSGKEHIMSPTSGAEEADA